MTALVIAPVSLPWPLFLVACLFTLIGLYVVLKADGKRLAAALLTACVLATPAILYAEELICSTCARCAVLTIWDPEYWLIGCWMLP